MQSYLGVKSVFAKVCYGGALKQTKQLQQPKPNHNLILAHLPLIESGANNNKLHLVALLMYTGTFFRLCFNVRMQYSSLLLHKEQI